MVDSISNIGSVQNINQTGKQSSKERADQTRESSEPQDKVEISEEALNRAEAEKAAEETRKALAENEELSLGLDPNFDDKR